MISSTFPPKRTLHVRLSTRQHNTPQYNSTKHKNHTRGYGIYVNDIISPVHLSDIASKPSAPQFELPTRQSCSLVSTTDSPFPRAPPCPPRLLRCLPSPDCTIDDPHPSCVPHCSVFPSVLPLFPILSNTPSIKHLDHPRAKTPTHDTEQHHHHQPLTSYPCPLQPLPFPFLSQPPLHSPTP